MWWLEWGNSVRGVGGVDYVFWVIDGGVWFRYENGIFDFGFYRIVKLIIIVIVLIELKEW